MPVTVAITWDPGAAITEAQYHDMAARLGTTDTLPAGCRHHAAGHSPDQGFMLLEIWESPEAFGHFAQTQLTPVSQELGVAPPSTVTVMPLVRVLSAS